MTTTFWLAATVLIVLALAFVAYPLLYPRSAQRHQRDLRQQNLMAYRSRLEELDRELATGNLDADNHRQLKDELEGSLLDDVGASRSVPHVGGGRRASAMVVGLASLVLVPAAAVYLYQQWGAMEQWQQYRSMLAMAADQGDRVAQMETLTAELRARLEASPENPDGWAMLGRSYMRIERYPDAAWAFEQLAGVVPNDQARAVAWGLSAQALFFESRGELDGKVTRAIDKARTLNPDEVNALGLLGIHAFSSQRFQDAIGYWERIVEVAPEHPQRPAIEEGIAQAYQNLGLTNPADSRQQTSDAATAGVSVRIELDEALLGEVPPEATLFVFARAPGAEGAPPVAVARRRAADLPLELYLDDSFAMNPALGISASAEVMVTARLSSSGNALPQPGDWQGQASNPIAVTAEAQGPVTITIDRQLP
ncbi:c-type cytochrome biogenesis protein CcmI [Marinobacter sp. SS21]|uniref:c-type cytochrome biogenesis protein CcmI n=1 Tax=Marinobacter sp. SS21 TaxID=2979460 RepID=UPI00232D2D84|nr:c-type cytochrome biogenesis protein CcmI [Marinobacter sp. SS21]MDC0662127.1 c-type cytochrome biogenesis protein CcmI [Marinobacter sp. SS21]